MNCLTRTTNVLSSTTSFQCIPKSLHVFSTITPQADLINRPNSDGLLVKKFSNFCIHPEKLKQIIKERDAQTLCHFYDSNEYKRKVTEIFHRQKQMIIEGTPIGTKDEDMKYEHILSCAQPPRRRRYSEPMPQTSSVRFKHENEKVSQKISIMAAILKQKRAEEKRNEIQAPQRKISPLFPAVKRTRLQTSVPEKKYKKRSTILPIYLRKMDRNMERKQQRESKVETSPFRETAKKISATENIDYNKQVLNVRNYKMSSDRRDDEDDDEEEESPRRYRNESKGAWRRKQERYVPENSKKKPVFYPDLKLVKYSNVVPKHLRAWPPKPKQKEASKKEAPTARDEKSARKKKPNRRPSSKNKFEARGHSEVALRSKGLVVDTSPKAETKKILSELSTQAKSSGSSPVGQGRQVETPKSIIKKQLSFLTKKLMPRRRFKKTQKLGESAKENLPATPIHMMDTIDFNKICRRSMSMSKGNNKGSIIDDVLTLFERVKSGTTLPRETVKYPFENETQIKNEPHLPRPSETYKIVNDGKKKRESAMKVQYELASKPGKEHICRQLVYRQKQNKVKAGEETKKVEGRIDNRLVDSEKKMRDVAVNRCVKVASEGEGNRKRETRYADFQKKTLQNEKAFVSRSMRDENEENRKLGRRMSKPPSPFVDIVTKDDSIPFSRTFHKWHLVRLPKTTPEGYRILMYSVRDNDPTKMNFSDCVKGFCMYNDCVLSEDGLQEGYVVIFDMKGVQIGHLARVSLPALRCFLIYIQEAHPCRLKSIHVLNTASWIHHIMRLIVPLVKSEILNLVKFHKGSIPEGLPLELLPIDLGGEAPSVEELDRKTKSMIHKYRDWLIETQEFISDESKRPKKASWWGFFNGSNKANNVELDEKTILKNLQID